MDSTTILLSLVGLLAILLLGAILLYCLCYLTGKDVDSDDDDDDVTQITNPTQMARPKTLLGRGKVVGLQAGRNKLLVAGGKQMMCSTLQRSATDSDVILATAVSAIPLKELGGRNNDVVVDVKQELLFNKEDEAHREESQCIVCKTRKEITWSQVSCYAQTTIGVLVYKRAINIAAAAAPAAAAVTEKSQSKTATKLSKLSLAPNLFPVAVETDIKFKSLSQLEPPKAPPTTTADRAKSVSATTLAPEPDSRLDIRTTGLPKQQLIRTTGTPASSGQQLQRSQATAPKPTTTKSQQQQQQPPPQQPQPRLH